MRMLNAIAELVAVVVLELAKVFLFGSLIFIVFWPLWGVLWFIFESLSEGGVRGCASDMIGMAVLIGIAWAGFKACGF